jgi:hypothetical protein
MPPARFAKTNCVSGCVQLDTQLEVHMSNRKSVEENLAEMRARHEARYGRPDVETVEEGRVRDFLLAMDEPADHVKPGAVVPALFLLTLARNRRPQAPRGSAVNAGDEFDLLATVLVGDTVTSTRELLGIDLKEGKRGLMYLARTRTTFINQHGERVAVSHQNTLRWGL